MSELTVPNLNVEMEIYASTNTGEPKKMYKPVLLDKISWTNTWDCNPSKMTFTTLKDAVINYGFGSKVVLKVNKEIVWVGYVFDKQRNADVKIKNTAYDQIRYLKNKITMSFEGKKTSEIVKKIVDEFHLPMEEIKGLNEAQKHADTVIDGEEACQVINEVLVRHLTYNQENLSFHDEKGKLVLKTIEDMRIKDQVFIPREMSDYDYSSGISDTYNSIVIDVLAYDGETHDRYVKLEDEESIKRWGLLRYVDKSNEPPDVVKSKAETLLKILNREFRTLKLKKVKGNFKVYPGSLVVVSLPLGDMVLKHWMVVKEVTHTIDETGYWMDMIVENSELGFAEPISPEGHFQVDKHESKDSVGDAGDIKGDTVQATIYNFLRSKGFSAAAACGIMGNMDAESGFNPKAQNVLPGGGSDGGYGLCQWTNTQGSPRRDKLFAWCRSANKDVNQVMSQLEYLIYEYSQPYYSQFLGDRYKKLTNVVQATADFLQYFEGYPSPYAEVQWPRRKATAEKYYNMWKDYDRVPTASSGGSGDGKFKQGWAWPLSVAHPRQGRPAGSDTNSAADYEVPVGTKVYACNGGTVDWVQYWDGRPPGAYHAMDNSTYGSCVKINHGNGWVTLYAHLSRINVKQGQKVSKGQQIGLSGSTGLSWGPHLHLEMRHNGVGVWPPSIYGH